MVKKISLLVLVFLFAMSGAVLAAIEVGDQLPDFDLKDLNDNDVKISDYWSNYTLIDVWATWCGPCVKAMKSYKQNYDMFEQAGIKIVAVSVDSKASAPVKYVAKNEIPFTVLHVNGSKATKELWGVRGIPTMFLIDADGNVVFKEVGFSDFATLWEELSHIVDMSNVRQESLPEVEAGSYVTNPVEINFSEMNKNLSIWDFMLSEEFDLQAEPMTELVNEPEYPNTPLYGMISFAGQEFTIVGVDSIPDETGWVDQLYVDYNGNKDLTDDGEPIQMEEYSSYTETEFTLNVRNDGQTMPLVVTCYSYKGDNKYYFMNGLGFKTFIITDGTPVKAMLLDANGNGQYTDAEDVVLMDLSGNGIYDSTSAAKEWTSLGEGINFGETTYTITVENGAIVIK